jgi:hypothetical protein
MHRWLCAGARTQWCFHLGAPPSLQQSQRLCPCNTAWRELLLDVHARGDTTAPPVATGDGALGFWAAQGKVFPMTRPQRRWVNKTANVLNKLPKSVQPKATPALRRERHPRRRPGLGKTMLAKNGVAYGEGKGMNPPYRSAGIVDRKRKREGPPLRRGTSALQPSSDGLPRWHAPRSRCSSHLFWPNTGRRQAGLNWSAGPVWPRMAPKPAATALRGRSDTSSANRPAERHGPRAHPRRGGLQFAQTPAPR